MHAAAVEQFVVAVGEAVGLVADALEELERAAVVRQADRLAAAGVFFKRATLPNFSNRRRFLFADMPGQSSSRLSFMRRR